MSEGRIEEPFYLRVPESAAERATRQALRGALVRRFGPPRAERPSTLFSLGGVGDGSATVEEGRSFLSQMAVDGLSTPTWPRDHGGAGLSPQAAAVLADELTNFDVPSLYAFRVGLSQVGQTIIACGNDEQRERWLPRIRSGEDIWCQLFSEPEAGSDLANVRTTATRVDGSSDWVVHGHKVWTSRGGYANLGFLLARTSPLAKGKHAGLTMFAIEMRQPGVTVRTVRQMNGDEQFSEVLFDGARIADEDRIGEVGEGWSVAVETLTHERAGAGSSLADNGSRPFVEAVRDTGALADPVVRRRTVDAVVALELSRLTTIRLRQAKGAVPMITKLLGGRAVRAAVDLLVDAHGPQGMLATNEGCGPFLTTPSLSIRGGTDEIVRNVLAERVLGLPRDPRPAPSA